MFRIKCIFILATTLIYLGCDSHKDSLSRKKVENWVDGFKSASRFQVPVYIGVNAKLAKVEFNQEVYKRVVENDWSNSLYRYLVINLRDGDVKLGYTDSISSFTSEDIKSWVKEHFANAESAKVSPEQVAFIAPTGDVKMRDLKILLKGLAAAGLDSVLFTVEVKGYSIYPNPLSARVVTWFDSTFNKTEPYSYNRMNILRKYISKEFNRCPSVARLWSQLDLELTPTDRKVELLMGEIYNALSDCDFKNYEAILTIIQIYFRRTEQLIWRGVLDRNSESLLVNDTTKWQSFADELFPMNEGNIWVE